jgi:hypothetical protein
MNTAPITTWEGASAYFTFANSPTMMGIILTAMTVITVYAVWSAMHHEEKAYEKARK